MSHLLEAKKLNISLFFTTQSNFDVPKNVRLNSTHVFNVKIQTRENFNKSQLIIFQI